MSVMTRLAFAAIALCLGFGLSAAEPGPNLIKNSDFSDGTSAWRVVKKQPTDVVDGAAGEPEKQLHVSVETDGGNSYGEISQKVPVDAFTTYRFTGMLRGTKDKLAFFQIKLVKAGKEQKRISTAPNTQEWATVTKEFSTGDADMVIVLCRYRMSEKHKWVGHEAWFANLTLQSLGRDPEAAPAADKAPGQQGAIEAPKAATVNTEALAAGSDIYVTPEGAGAMDGTSWENAMPGTAEGALQAAWDATGAANTMHLGSGSYPNGSLTLNSSGHDMHRVKRLLGVDTGAGLPSLTGDWTKDDPAKGAVFASIDTGVSHVVVESLRLENYRGAVHMNGRNVNVSIIDVDIRETRDAFIIVGGGNEIEPLASSHDVLIKDCDVTYFTKRAVRIKDGAYRLRIVNTHADAGGQEWAVEKFHMAFHVEGRESSLTCHDIAYIRCTARNSYSDHGDGYWNADGFAAERNAYNISYIGCESYDHTDGGWDDKSLNPILVNCVAAGSKRNVRIWSAGGATIVGCLISRSHKRGGIGSSAGLHVNATAVVRVMDTVFYDNPIQVHMETDNAKPDRRPRVEMLDCIVVNDQADPAKRYVLEEGADLHIDRQREYVVGDGTELPAIIQSLQADYDSTLREFVERR